MKIKTQMLALLILGASQSASAHGGALWYMSVLSYCMVQDPSHASLPMGKALAAEEGIQRWMQSLSPENKRCIISSKPVPEQLCLELLSPQPNQRQNKEELKKIHKKYSGELEKLSNLRCS